ncbi:MAG: sigma-54-dependent Fis family transcriptional regulator [Gammaproteobacteria bacterium]|nr:sigma-54-dependent Fis family transcriptional regulator [Gammaproteobacteria bacterium]
MNPFEDRLIGQSPQLEALMRAAKVVAATDVTVLLQGESGTGKELLAAALHQASRRREAPFVSINCAALPDTLAESELFGHRKGAFTGADSHAGGRIAAAAGGTLFLDEIGELSLPIQAKLLRFLESGECQRLGESTPHRVDTRLIAASHRDLLQRVAEGAFRKDLFYRIHVVPLELPPLRERSGEIPYLLAHFSTQLAQQHQLTKPRFHRDCFPYLDRYPWPGNVRELRNFCERMVILFSGRTIHPDNLPREILAPNTPESGGIELPEGGLRLDEVEKRLITKALDRCRGNRSKAARLLGLTRDTLLYRIKKHALSPDCP